MKNILIACISYFSEKSKYEIGADGKPKEKLYPYTADNISFTAHQTNEACLKFLTKKLENTGGIHEYICLKSVAVSNESFTMEHIRTSINKFCIDNEIKDRPIFTEYSLTPQEENDHRYDNILNKIAQRVLEIARNEAKSKPEASNSDIRIYLDVAGGKRDNFIFIQLLTKLLSFYGYGTHAYYADLTGKNLEGEKIGTIVNTDTSFVQMNMLDAVNEFVRHGTVASLRQCFRNVNNIQIKNLFKSMEKFGNSVQFCDTELSQKLRDIEEKLNELEANLNDTDSDAGAYIIKTMIPLFRKKFYIDTEQHSSESSTMNWCLENGLIQQALTIYNEKVRKSLFEKHFIEIDNSKYVQAIKQIHNERTHIPIHNIKINYILEKIFENARANQTLNENYKLYKVRNLQLKWLYGAYLFSPDLIKGITIKIDTELCHKLLIDCNFINFMRNRVNHAADSNQYDCRMIDLYKHGLRENDYRFSTFNRDYNIVSFGFNNDMRRALKNFGSAVEQIEGNIV